MSFRPDLFGRKVPAGSWRRSREARCGGRDGCKEAAGYNNAAGVLVGNRLQTTDRGRVVSITFEAVYENTVLKPEKPLPLKEQEKVRVTVHTSLSVARQTAGMIPWKGDLEPLERLARDPEFGILESPCPLIQSARGSSQDGHVLPLDEDDPLGQGFGKFLLEREKKLIGSANSGCAYTLKYACLRDGIPLEGSGIKGTLLACHPGPSWKGIRSGPWPVRGP